MTYQRMIDWSDELILATLRDNQPITRQKTPMEFITETEVLSMDGQFVNNDVFWLKCEELIFRSIYRARELRQQNVWSPEVFSEMMLHDGAIVFVLEFYLTAETGGIVDIPDLVAGYEEALQTPQYAQDKFCEWDEFSSPLGMSQWEGHDSDIPMLWPAEVAS